MQFNCIRLVSIALSNTLSLTIDIIILTALTKSLLAYKK